LHIVAMSVAFEDQGEMEPGRGNTNTVAAVPAVAVGEARASFAHWKEMSSPYSSRASSTFLSSDPIVPSCAPDSGVAGSIKWSHIASKDLTCGRDERIESSSLPRLAEEKTDEPGRISMVPEMFEVRRSPQLITRRFTAQTMAKLCASWR
jgi:hypothetical protein